MQIFSCIVKKKIVSGVSGVKKTFKIPDIKKLFAIYDVIIIVETHFRTRLKCPEDFICIGRSDHVLSKRPRGGVVVFKRFT